MKFTADAKSLSAPVAAAGAVVEGRTLPILGNLLLRLEGGRLAVTGSDLEIEINAGLDVAAGETGAITVPAKKLRDILRTLPAGASVSVEIKDEKAVVRSGSSRFSLGTLPAANFPAFAADNFGEWIEVPGRALATLLDKTGFAMADKDVRYYLNGLYLECAAGVLRAVASDGHRLAVCEASVGAGAPFGGVIVPRKAVAEIAHLAAQAETVRIRLAPNALQAEAGGVALSAKLIEGRFPDYNRVMPRDLVRRCEVSRAELLAALARVSLLSNEKYKSVSVGVRAVGVIALKAANPEAEEATDEVSASVSGGDVEVGFNAAYLMDALNHVGGERAVLELPEFAKACLVTDPADPSYRFVVMPMRL